MPKYMLGAKRNPPRLIKEYACVGMIPNSVTTDISMLPVLNQGQQPACVGHAMANAIAYDYYKKTGKVPLISPRWIYSQAKLVDGDPQGDGTSAHFAFVGTQKAGGAATVATVPNDVTLSLLDYKTVLITDTITQEAKLYPIINNVEVTNPTSEQLQSMIAEYGVIIIASDVDENSWMFQDGKDRLLPGTAGLHETILFAYQSSPSDCQFWDRNSWGTDWGYGGNGTFFWSDYQGNIYDAMSVEIDMNNPITMQTATLNRTSDDGVQTKGVFTFGTTTCYSLERPWLNNQVDVSCIPEGTYTCLWTFMPDMNTYHYELQNVTGRTGIFIHNGNFVTDTEGCILLGNGWGVINGTEPDVLNSDVTLADFEKWGNKLPISLTIQ